MPLAAGTNLGPYEILALIGAGGMGEVYRARDTRLGREVAVKVLPESVSADPERVRRFEQEARAAGMLNHPNIVAIYDVGTHNGCSYVVSELLEGETLRKRISEGAMAQRKTIEYGLQIAQGLAAAHAKGIVHRDLKPDNLFLTNDGRVKILDFGLAKLMDRGDPSDRTSAPTVAVETSPGVVMGTMGYMSPEQVRGQPTDHRTDIFTLGAILYEMLAGRRAFAGASSADVMSAILKEDPPELPVVQVSTGLDRVLRHCLEKRPEDRFESARDLAFALESLSGFSGASGAVAATPPQSRRRLWPALLALNVAVLLAIGAVAWRRPRPVSAVRLQRLTFRHGSISGARFTPDGQTVVYSAAWDGKPDAVFSTRSNSTESRAFDLPRAILLGISGTGDMALSLNARFLDLGVPIGTLAQAPVSGGSPRELTRDVTYAEWSPDGSAMAIVRREGSRTRLEFPPGKALYSSPGLIANPRISPAGDRIAFYELLPADIANCALSMVDLAGNKKVLANHLIGMGTAWAPDGQEIWFAAVWNSAPAIYAVDLSGKARQVHRMGGLTQVQDISREGRVLLVQSDLTAAMMYFGPGEKRERDLAWLDWSLPRRLSDDGKLLLFDEGHEGGAATGGIYLRRTDGSTPVRLGDGFASDLSPDGQWVAGVRRTHELTLLPVGAGESRLLRNQGIHYISALWFPDGKRLLATAAETGRPARLWIRDLSEGGAPKPIAPEGSSALAISPDGKLIAAMAPDHRPVFYPADGGDAQAIPHLSVGDIPIRWGLDNGTLFTRRGEGMEVRIYRVDVASGREELMHVITPADPAGTYGPTDIHLSADGKNYVYQAGRMLSNLYVAAGLR
jgi:Tol biopolymer transport system component